MTASIIFILDFLIIQYNAALVRFGQSSCLEIQKGHENTIQKLVQKLRSSCEDLQTRQLTQEVWKEIYTIFPSTLPRVLRREMYLRLPHRMRKREKKSELAFRVDIQTLYFVKNKQIILLISVLIRNRL